MPVATPARLRSHRAPLPAQVLPGCALHALIFCAIGVGAAFMVERGLLVHDLNSVFVSIGVVMSLLLLVRMKH